MLSFMQNFFLTYPDLLEVPLSLAYTSELMSVSLAVAALDADLELLTQDKTAGSSWVNPLQA